MTTPEGQAELYRFPPLFSPEDVQQERHVAKLEGTKPRQYRQSSQVCREYGYGLAPADSHSSVFAPEHPDPDVLERLIEWTLHQERRVAVAVLRYLDEPVDELLDHVRSLIHHQARVQVVTRPDIPLSTLIFRALPADVDQLYELARISHQSRRPEAAVRQTLRNLSRQDRITQDAEGVWSAK